MTDVEDLKALLDDRRYSARAYGLVLAAVEYALRETGARRHISGAELLEALCELAARRFGMLAARVMDLWGIRRSEDVGHIVFRLVEAGLLSKQPQDSMADFEGRDLRAALRAKATSPEALRLDEFGRERIGLPPLR